MKPSQRNTGELVGARAQARGGKCRFNSSFCAAKHSCAVIAQSLRINEIPSDRSAGFQPAWRWRELISRLEASAPVALSGPLPCACVLIALPAVSNARAPLFVFMDEQEDRFESQASKGRDVGKRIERRASS